MNILVLGAGGMAGHTVSIYLREKGHSIDTISATNPLDKNTVLMDVTNKEKLESYLTENDYDVVINCIGLLVKQSEDRNDLAVYLNSYLPHFLENHYKKTKTKLIHLSTDCVFSGNNAPYHENSTYDGDLFYDRSKALGEIINEKDLTFRMSIIGPDMKKNGTGLFNWFYAQSGEISGYTKAMWNGVTTLELAKGINAAISQELCGLYHFVPAENISKFELLKLFKEVFNRKDIVVNPSDTLEIDKTLINTRSDFNYSVPKYTIMVEEMKNWIDAHPSLYAHYERNEG